MSAFDVQVADAMQDEPRTLDEVRSLLGKIEGVTLAEAQKMIREEQMKNNAPLSLTGIQLALYTAERRLDARRLEYAIQKAEEQVQKTSKSVAALTKWSHHMDKSLEDTLAMAVCNFTDGEMIDMLKELKDDTGRVVVEFDGAVNGEIEGRPVLVLIESKHNLRQEDVDISACRNADQEHDCLPSRAIRYKEAYEGQLKEWKNAATGKLERRLGKQCALIQELKLRETELLFAVGSRRFPESLQNFCKRQGYLCIVPTGKGFEVK